MGTVEGREDMKATGGTEGTEATGIGTGAVNGWVGGVAAAKIGLGCGARTDLVTSSNHRSASDGVRLWEGMTGEDVGGTTITGVGDDQLLPVGRKYTGRKKKKKSEYISNKQQTQAQFISETKKH